MEGKSYTVQLILNVNGTSYEHVDEMVEDLISQLPDQFSYVGEEIKESEEE